MKESWIERVGARAKERWMEIERVGARAMEGGIERERVGAKAMEGGIEWTRLRRRRLSHRGWLRERDGEREGRS